MRLIFPTSAVRTSCSWWSRFNASVCFCCVSTRAPASRSWTWCWRKSPGWPQRTTGARWRTCTASSSQTVTDTDCTTWSRWAADLGSVWRFNFTLHPSPKGSVRERPGWDLNLQPLWCNAEQSIRTTQEGVQTFYHMDQNHAVKMTARPKKGKKKLILTFLLNNKLSF